MKRWCLVGAVLGIAACGGDTGPSSLTSVVISGDSTVVLNGTIQLTATAFAGNTPIESGLTFVWLSSDTSRVRVSPTGVVTGAQLGSATITVIASPPVSAAVASAPHAIRTKIGRIVFQPFDVSLTSLRDTLIVHADARDAQNSTVPGITFTWQSRNTGVVTVADSGTHSAFVVSVGNGITRIVATGAGASDSLTASVQQVATTAAILPASIDSLTAFGRSVQATCVAVDSMGDSIPTIACSWSGTPGVVSVSPATAHTTTVTAVGNGSGTIQAQAAPGVTASRAVRVNQIPKTVLITPANFGTPDVMMRINQSAPFFAAVFDSLDHPAVEDSVTWSSDNTGVADVAAAATLDSTVVTTFASAGTATITATAGPASGTRVVNVSATALTLSGDVQPILNTSSPACTSCHPSAAGMDLTAGNTFSNVVNVTAVEAPALQRVRPFLPDSSYLVHKIQGTQATVGGSGERMPLGCSGSGCLSNAAINIIRNWILQGALNN
jgi:Bacterial Ig-like domain (group 2)